MTGRHSRSNTDPTTATPGAEEDATAVIPRVDGEEPPKSILEQLGGVSGMIYSTVPVVVFVLVNAVASLGPALVAAIGVAVAIAVWRLVRKEPLQPAVSGLFGVAIGAFIAHRTGEARDFFLLGIWYSALLGVVFLVSALVRWPLAGVIWHGINGDGQGWRSDRELRRAYTLATLLWAVMFGVKFVAQQWLYDANQPGWLAVARIAGYALTGLALLGTLWAVRRARERSAATQAA
ncbi:MAG: hypothetical protein QOC83_4858 [Pseudonocardiales bacterium]|nr:hypothetical protein [Pseudonocardiales bacterium]